MGASQARCWPHYGKIAQKALAFLNLPLVAATYRKLRWSLQTHFGQFLGSRRQFLQKLAGQLLSRRFHLGR